MKFEIIFEGHIALDAPLAGDRGDRCGGVQVARQCRSVGRPVGVVSRRYRLGDVAGPGDRFDNAVLKAGQAYGGVVVRCLNSAVDYLCGDGDNPPRLGRVMAELRVDVAEDVLWRRVAALRR